MDQNTLKEFAKVVSTCISELSSSLDTYVEDEKDPKTKSAFKEQIKNAKALSDSLDDMIFKIAMSNLKQG